jgi:hypothetical protein
LATSNKRRSERYPDESAGAPHMHTTFDGERRPHSGVREISDGLDMHEGSGVVGYWFEALLFGGLTLGLAAYGLYVGFVAIARLTGLPLALWCAAGLVGLPCRFRNHVSVDSSELVVHDEARRTQRRTPLSDVVGVAASFGTLGRMMGYTTVCVETSELS